jgi:hypothetical protein
VHLFRLLLTWLLLAAVPIQGFAAASMGAVCLQMPSGQMLSSAHGALGTQGVNGNSNAAATAEQLPSESDSIGQHAVCAVCALACCHSAAPTTQGASSFGRDDSMQSMAYLPTFFHSWSEPVPDKPPRC